MGKGYRGLAVEAAVQSWTISEWFTCEQILGHAVECLPQRSMSINVYSLSRYLTAMERRGSLLSRRNGSGTKEYRRVEGEEDDGCSHLYA